MAHLLPLVTGVTFASVLPMECYVHIKLSAARMLNTLNAKLSKLSPDDAYLSCEPASPSDARDSET